jgi:fused signal recognition particle receptor
VPVPVIAVEGNGSTLTMLPIVVVIVVITVALVAFFVLRRKGPPDLPEERDEASSAPAVSDRPARKPLPEASAAPATVAKREAPAAPPPPGAPPAPAAPPPAPTAAAPTEAAAPASPAPGSAPVEAAAPPPAPSPIGAPPPAATVAAATAATPTAARVPTKADPVETGPLRATTRPPAGADDVAALKKGLASTRGGFIARLAKMLSRKKEIDPALLEQIEEVLLGADLGPRTAQKILDRLRERMNRHELSDEDRVWAALREEAREILGARGGAIALQQKPTVILVVGVNGVGKTTTIGKLASRFTQNGKKVVLAAGDTFRAAAVLQLEVWGRRVGCPVVKGKENADPGAVIFDAIKRAQAEGADIVLADTAGRLHTKLPLMDELKKVGRTVEKALERPADEVILVLDSTNGQNAIQQAQIFKEAMAVTGIVLTKLDGTAKGGVVLGIADEHGIPVRYVGIGERVEDLREFDASSFVEALFEKPPEDAAEA